MCNASDAEISKLAGKLAAMSFAVNALLAVYPDKRSLSRCWDAVMPERIDEWMEEPAYQNPVLREEMNRHLAGMRELIGFDPTSDDAGDD